MVLTAKKTLHALVMLGIGWLATPATAQTQKQLSDAELMATLKRGGNIIYLRHMETDVTFSDQNREDLTDWSKQRNLTTKGRQQAAAFGHVFRALNIPVFDIVSSPYCRCIETGKLAFGKVGISKDLAFAIVTDKSEADRLGKALKVMLGNKPPAGSNTILIAHSANLQEAANLWPKPEGVAFVFKPLGNGNFEALHRIEPQQWVPLAAKLGNPVDPVKLQAHLPERSQLCGKGV